MKSWRFHEFGNIANLKLEETPKPVAGDGEALLRVQFAAINPADRYLVQGQYPTPAKPPFAVGRDGCGIVETSSGEFQPGDHVILLRSSIGVEREGTLAEYVAVPEASLAPLPDGWSPEEGAAGPLVFLTAWQALVTDGALREGETVMVTGASGGVGTAAVILAKALGAKVVALSRSEAKRQRLIELGADFVVDSASENLGKSIKSALDGGRVDLVVENLGGPHIQHSLEVLAKKGRINVVGLLTGLMSEVQVALLLFKRAVIRGISVGDFTEQEAQEAWRGIVATLDKAGQRPVVDRVFAFTEVQEAFAHMAKGPMGKVLVAAPGSPPGAPAGARDK